MVVLVVLGARPPSQDRCRLTAARQGLVLKARSAFADRAFTRVRTSRSRAHRDQGPVGREPSSSIAAGSKLTDNDDHARHLDRRPGAPRRPRTRLPALPPQPRQLDDLRPRRSACSPRSPASSPSGSRCATTAAGCAAARRDRSEADLSEFAIDLSTTERRAPAAMITVRNNGTMVHNLAVRGTDLRLRRPRRRRDRPSSTSASSNPAPTRCTARSPATPSRA